MQTGFWRLLVCMIVLAASVAWAAEVEVRLPDGQMVKVEAGRPVDIKLADGKRLVGVDMRWYAKAKGDGEPLSDDDRKEIDELLTVPSFYDKTRILHLAGDAQRAVGLVELVRDRDFYAGKGEVVWRAELWYFEFQNGGWAKVSQQNKLLDRQRFGDHETYRKYVEGLRFVPKLGSLGATTRPAVVELTREDLVKVGE